MDQLLLFEYLHADHAAFQQAPVSMRREGRAMLQALLEDSSALPHTDVAVVLCDDARLSLNGCLSNVTVHNCGDDSDAIAVLAGAAQTADIVLPVAPECDGILLNIARALHGLSCCTLLPSISTVATCGDKLQTWEHFATAGVPMLECSPAEDTSAAEVSPQTIFKLRQGAGCDGVQRGSLPALGSPEDYIRQAWLDGRSLSMGLIGGPDAVHRLPLAEQKIHWQDAHPQYRGGTIPADVPAGISGQVDEIVSQVLPLIGNFRGYTGLDFLLSAADGTVYLNEINPRLCTSYIGYQQFCSANLLSLMTGGTSELSTECSNTTVRFEAAGSAIVG